MSNHLRELTGLSHYAAKPFWVQGPGGNTSVKDENGNMWVKASGGFLGEVNETNGWVKVSLQQVSNTLKQEGLNGREPEDAEQVNKAVTGSVKETAAAGLRPSMETAFHSLYPRYVLHTHSAFANIYLCSDHSEDIQECLPAPEACFSSLLGDYYTPGAELSWMLYDIFRFQPVMPQITLLPNHGIIISADTMEEVIKLNDDLHAALCKKLNLTDEDYPSYSLQQDEKGYVLSCKYLEDHFSKSGPSPKIFTEYLVPDHIVYLYPEDYSTENREAKIHFDSAAKIIRLNTNRKEAVAIAELMINNAFLHEQITVRGFEPLTINYDADKLRNMGAERFRRKSME